MRYQGKYRPSFPMKYRGDVNDIVYRSSWEYKFMKWIEGRDKCLLYKGDEAEEGNSVDLGW